MIKMRILFIGLVTALALLAAVPAMAVNCKDDCIIHVTMENETDQVQYINAKGTKCILHENIDQTKVNPGDSYTFVLKYDMDAMHCQEIGMFEHNNGYFWVATIGLNPQSGARSDWEAHIDSKGDGENLWISSLENKGSGGSGMSCSFARGNTIQCIIRGKIKGGAEF